MKCLVVDDDPLIVDLLQYYISKVEFLESGIACSSAVQALEILREHEISLILLDIELPDMSGMDLLRALDTDVPVVMVTSSRDFAVDSYNYNVVDYLVKPLDFPRFWRSVDKARKRMATPTETQQDQLFVKDGRSLVKIELPRVLYIEAASNYVTFVYAQGAQLALSSMKNLEEQLPPEFLRVHRSYIINTAKIESVGPNELVIGAKTIPISPLFREQLIRKLNLLQ